VVATAEFKKNSNQQTTSGDRNEKIYVRVSINGTSNSTQQWGLVTIGNSNKERSTGGDNSGNNYPEAKKEGRRENVNNEPSAKAATANGTNRSGNNQLAVTRNKTVLPTGDDRSSNGRVNQG